jgi:hypothetical protein
MQLRSTGGPGQQPEFGAEVNDPRAGSIHGKADRFLGDSRRHPAAEQIHPARRAQLELAWRLEDRVRTPSERDPGIALLQRHPSGAQFPAGGGLAPLSVHRLIECRDDSPGQDGVNGRRGDDHHGRCKRGDYGCSLDAAGDGLHPLHDLAQVDGQVRASSLDACVLPAQLLLFREKRFQLVLCILPDLLDALPIVRTVNLHRVLFEGSRGDPVGEGIARVQVFRLQQGLSYERVGFADRVDGGKDAAVLQETHHPLGRLGIGLQCREQLFLLRPRQLSVQKLADQFADVLILRRMAHECASTQSRS